MEALDISIETGIPYNRVKARAVRLGINTSGHLSKDQIESLSIDFEKGFAIVPSKMNYKDKKKV